MYGRQMFEIRPSRNPSAASRANASGAPGRGRASPLWASQTSRTARTARSGAASKESTRCRATASGSGKSTVISVSRRARRLSLSSPSREPIRDAGPFTSAATRVAPMSRKRTGFPLSVMSSSGGAPQRLLFQRQLAPQPHGVRGDAHRHVSSYLPLDLHGAVAFVPLHEDPPETVLGDELALLLVDADDEVAVRILPQRILAVLPVKIVVALPVPLDRFRQLVARALRVYPKRVADHGDRTRLDPDGFGDEGLDRHQAVDVLDPCPEEVVGAEGGGEGEPALQPPEEDGRQAWLRAGTFIAEVPAHVPEAEVGAAAFRVLPQDLDRGGERVGAASGQAKVASQPVPVGVVEVLGQLGVEDRPLVAEEAVAIEAELGKLLARLHLRLGDHRLDVEQLEARAFAERDRAPEPDRAHDQLLPAAERPRPHDLVAGGGRRLERVRIAGVGDVDPHPVLLTWSGSLRQLADGCLDLPPEVV